MEQSNEETPEGVHKNFGRETYTDDGQQLVSTTVSEFEGKQSITRTECTPGPFWPVECRTFNNDELVSRSVTEYDAHGNSVAEQSFDANGKLANYSKSKYDEKERNIDWIVVTPGTSFLHQSDEYDGDELIQRKWFDQQGKLICTISLLHWQVTSSWQDPDTKGSENGNFSIGVNLENDKAVDWELDGGRLIKTVENHPDRFGNIEPDDIVRTDDTGRLLDKVQFQYIRDSYGNWTTRFVSVWNPSTNGMVEIERDTRVITYY